MGGFRFIDRGPIPCLSISAPGGVLAWQDWMSDAVAFLAGTKPDGSFEGTLVSFVSGQTLWTTALTGDDLQKLIGTTGHSLACDELGKDLQLEGLLYKNEPFDATGGVLEGIRHAMQGKLVEALAAYDRAIAADNRLLRVSNLRGLSLRLLGRPKEAEKAYLREIELNPLLPDPFGNLGILYLKTGREKQARTMFERALERDQFYLNALIHLGKMLLESEGPGNRLLSILNLRLVTVYADLIPAQEQISASAAKTGLPIPAYLERLRSELGWLADPLILRLLRRVEQLRLNGALTAAVRGFGHLLARAGQNPSLQQFLNHWISRRMSLMAPVVPEFLRPLWDKSVEELTTQNPTLAAELTRLQAAEKSALDASSQQVSVPAESGPRETALSPLEFFELFLTEICRDGQITPAETQMVFRLKEALRIDETTHQRLFKQVTERVRTSPLADDGGEFNGKRLFASLVAAVSRDGKLDSTERKLLQFAKDILELLPEDIDPRIAEVIR